MNPFNKNLKSEIDNCMTNINEVVIAFNHPYREKYLRFVSNIKKCLSDEVDTLDMFRYLMVSERINSYYSKKNDYQSLKVIGKNSDKTQIYATVHLGAYKLIAGYLLRNGVNLCVPITKRVYNEQLNHFKQLKDSSQSYIGNIDFIDIEERSGIFKMIKYVKNGYSILMYLDGNSGIGGMERSDDKLVSIDFFEKKIMVRKGIGFISSALKLPVQPVVSYLNKNTNTPYIHFLDIVSFAEDKSISSNVITRNLWNIFCDYIRIYPEQWEGWLYVDAFYENKIIKKEETQINDKLRFNSERYDFINKDHSFYLYDLYGNVLVKTSEGLFNLFHTMNRENIHLDCNEFYSLIKKESLFKEIISSSILTT